MSYNIDAPCRHMWTATRPWRCGGVPPMPQRAMHAKKSTAKSAQLLEKLATRCRLPCFAICRHLWKLLTPKRRCFKSRCRRCPRGAGAAGARGQLDQPRRSSWRKQRRFYVCRWMPSCARTSLPGRSMCRAGRSVPGRAAVASRSTAPFSSTECMWCSWTRRWLTRPLPLHSSKNTTSWLTRRATPLTLARPRP